MTRILIDLQACQNESRFRGLGRYVKNMAREIAKIAAPGSVHLLLNSRFGHTILPLRQYFSDFVPDANIHVVELLDQADDRSERGRWRNDASALMREAYIEMLAPDVVFMPSFFEGFIDDVVLSVHRLSRVPVVATVHDLIPLILEERYLKPDPNYSRFYRGKLAEFVGADGLIAISEQSFKEAVELLHYPAEKAVNASEGAEPEFRPLGLSDEQKAAARARFGVGDQFIFYTGGADSRKNLDRLMAAFARLPQALRGEHQLVLAGSISPGERQHLLEKADAVGLDRSEYKLLGFVSDADLVELYNLCEVFVFPSLHEGFGLPCLEAMQCGAAVIGSNVSSIPEVMGNDDAMFDPHSVGDMARVLDRVLTDDAFRAELVAKGAVQAAKFSWSKSAEIALAKLLETAQPNEPGSDWTATRLRLDAVEQQLVAALKALSGQFGHPNASDLAQIAQAMAINRVRVANLSRSYDLPEVIDWRIEGPFDSSYSLALVNRELALGLEQTGARAALHASEGPGDYEADKGFLKANPQIAALHARSSDSAAAQVVSRNMYPPRAVDMDSQINGLSCYAWEETGFPFAYAEGINEGAQFVTVTAEHVKKVLIDAGVSVPVTVVGNGVDHWLAVEADKSYRIETAGHTFLHVSSCFPRKGADVLLKSYGAAFRKDDDVLLVIKTFANPHNTIEQQLAALRATNPDFPAVTIIMDDLSDGALKALYEQCDTLVAPSRAEGFGLPIAEAMLSGLHVITTGWSGQMDFCTPENSALIDFTFASASTHEASKPLSAWAEPDGEHLTQLLREALERKAGDATKTLLPRWSWAEVARRNQQAARALSVEALTAEPRLGWVSTYRKRCGIATYSEHLLDVLGMPAIILADAPDDLPTGEPENIVRCWREGKVDDFSNLLAAVKRHQLDMVVIQFNYGFFDFAAFGKLLHSLCDAGTRVVVTMHATIDPAHDPDRKLAHIADALARCDRLLVHSITDLNRLKALGLVDNVGLFPHGVLASPAGNTARPAAHAPVHLASYGFFLPNKGLIELAEAARLLKAENFAFKLDMVNAAFPAEVSQKLIEQARGLIDRYGLGSEVKLHTDFLPDAESLRLLSQAEIVVYPYQNTAESASGAVRYGLAAGKAVAVTPLPIFDDVAGSVFALPGISPADIATGLKQLSRDLRANAAESQAVLERAQQWRDVHAYPVLGRKLAGTLRGIFRNSLDKETTH